MMPRNYSGVPKKTPMAGGETLVGWWVIRTIEMSWREGEREEDLIGNRFCCYFLLSVVSTGSPVRTKFHNPTGKKRKEEKRKKKGREEKDSGPNSRGRRKAIGDGGRHVFPSNRGTVIDQGILISPVVWWRINKQSSESVLPILHRACRQTSLVTE
ncbi:hypothetical protein P170DRAFT_248424 [Aspergillus steynii IBT 23096]|uniref:Uncharacterized protein n=1 Tax=Aspergillus steynii IBT 23096 TaxID=1392250 RepID=A0A2I2FYD8_9EURO|nr:uncharacterized protein P170DRAFT_248424 [Aspergillus steynii IBT 23096]PLB45651.1 hypothetical protein P170DRAFT_248424 [Aspergillus steynii IBT 23096]